MAFFAQKLRYQCHLLVSLALLFSLCGSVAHGQIQAIGGGIYTAGVGDAGGQGGGQGGGPFVVAGNIQNQATVWDSNSQTMTLLPFLDPQHNLAETHAVSTDGSTVVGFSASNVSNSRSIDAFVYDVAAGVAGTNPKALPLPAGATDSSALDVDATGQHIVGWVEVGGSGHAVVWDGTTNAPEILGAGSSQMAINDVGSRIVAGRRIWNKGQTTWQQDPNLIPLVTGFNRLAAHEISGDGRYVFGGTENVTACGNFPCVTPGPTFRWDSTTPSVAPQVLNNICNVAGVSGDGSVVVGNLGGGFCTGGAAYWSPTTGAVPLDGFLTSQGVDVSGWTLSVATGVSDDGKTFSGHGFHNGDPKMWIVTVPEPSTYGAFGLAGVACLMLRRRHGVHCR